MNSKRQCDECQEVFLVALKNWEFGEGYNCRSSKACQVGYGFAHGSTKFV